jgi:CDP-diacylglycerol--serine O-phosphatidyltransferase
MDPEPRKHLSMFRSFVLADLITLANAGCGMATVLLCLNHVSGERTPYLWAVFVLIPSAIVFDLLDGYVARRQSRHSALGADLDSLSDIVSFGVAPAALGFALGLRGLWDGIILVYFVACGISRLARFNVAAALLAEEKGKVKYYEGTPITSSIIIVAILGIAYGLGRIDDRLPLGALYLGPWRWHPLSVLYAVNGSSMISSTIRIPKP